MPQRTGRHRAPSAHSRTLSTLAAASAALGASLLTPAVALAAPGHSDGSALRHATDRPGTHHEGRNGARHARAGRVRPIQHPARRAGRAPTPTLRPMTSGEHQYRNGCLQGYITEDCEQFSASELIRQGINPYL